MLKELSVDVSKDDLFDENEDSKEDDRDFTFGLFYFVFIYYNYTVYNLFVCFVCNVT